MSATALQWGPVAIIMIGLILGFYFNNRSIAHLDKRIDDFRGAVDHRFDAVDRRFDDMREWIRSEFKRVDERLDNHGYIVPGLGDAGNRMYGTK